MGLVKKSGDKVQIFPLSGCHIFKFGEFNYSNDRVLVQWVPNDVETSLEHTKGGHKLIRLDDFLRFWWAHVQGPLLKQLTRDGRIDVQLGVFDIQPPDPLVTIANLRGQYPFTFTTFMSSLGGLPSPFVTLISLTMMIKSRSTH